MTLFGATIFLGAFLLFLVEPLVAKMLLPLFGGSAAVWLAALLFFQGALLAGYLYADRLSRKIPARLQAAVHFALLAAALLFLPLAPRGVAMAEALGPTARVLWVLVATAGVPFLALAATGPLVQAFWARVRAGSPYRLYALSNLGSMLGLLAYPALVEPALGLRAQSLVWSAGFAVFAVLCGALALRVRGAPPAAAAGGVSPEPALADRLGWVALPLCSSALLSAVTSDLTLNVAPIPLLWVLPLAAYLLSFVLCFQSERVYRRGLWLVAFAAALGYLAWRAKAPMRGEYPVAEIGASIAGLFVCCMVLHGELARIKPAPRHLTRYYFWLALGGALGGAFVAVLAPLIFRSDLDLPCSLVASALAVASLLWSARPSLYGFPLARVSRAALVLGIAVLSGALAVREAQVRRRSVFFDRDFYGSLRVEDEAGAPGEKLRTLVHGTTVHGSERISASGPGEPLGYYGADSGVALALRALGKERPSIRVGIVGLGAGVLAAFCRPSDEYAFYEIDPLMERVAKEQFGFLRRCARQRVVLGDARITLGAAPDQRLDALVVDAFSGDSVPVHLLTVEAFRLFDRHLAPGGLLVLHVSNRFLDLEPVVASAAERIGWKAYVVHDEGDQEKFLYSTRWMLVVRDPALLARLDLEEEGAEAVRVPPRFRPWTDDHSNLVAVLH